MKRKHILLVQQGGTIYANVQSRNCMRCYVSFVLTLVASTLVVNPTLQRDASTLTSLMKDVTTHAQFAQRNGTTNSFQCIVQVLLHSLTT